MESSKRANGGGNTATTRPCRFRKRLVDSLLLLARSEAGALPVSSERVDLAAVAGEVVALLAVLAEERHQSLVSSAAEPVLVTGDAGPLPQVLAYLVDNAIKQSREGGRIAITVAGRDGRAEGEPTEEGSCRRALPAEGELERAIGIEPTTFSLGMWM